MTDFESAYRQLELRFEHMVQKDNEVYDAGSLYLPNVAPLAPVDFVLIGSEPSRGTWGQTDAKAHESIAKGFRNFGGCKRCEPLHYCVDEFLCQGSGSYYLTDLAKGAVSGVVPWRKAWEKYERWYCLLREELALVAKPDATVISIGDKAAGFLAQRGLHGHVGKVPHYSGRARNHGKMADAFPLEWESFRSTPLELGREGEVSEAKKRWMFDYRVLFERYRPCGDADWRPCPGRNPESPSGSLRPLCSRCNAS